MRVQSSPPAACRSGFRLSHNLKRMVAMKRHESKRALVIGSEGNIGKPLVSYLKSMGYAVLESDIRPGLRPGYVVADITHPLDLLPAFDWGPDVVFLLAAVV